MSSTEPTADDHVTAFRDAMQKDGITFAGTLIADGKFHRVHGDADKKGRRNTWYVLYLDGRPAGAYGSLSLYGEEVRKWSAKGSKPLTKEERRAFAEKMREEREKKLREEAQRNASAAIAANSMWNAAKDAGNDHPYLKRKGVPGFGLRVGDWVKESPPDAVTREVRTYTVKDTLLVPLRDEMKNIVSLQGIFAKESKVGGEQRTRDFVYGGRKRGAWFTIGRPTEVDGKITVCICEGYATGASVHVATGMAVVVAFDMGNLMPVAQTVRRLMPDVRIVITADNDQFTLKPVENPGLTKARDTAEAVGGMVAFPVFRSLDGKPTDFNDLHLAEGADEVKRQIMNVICPPPPEPSAAAPDEEPPAHEAVPDHADTSEAAKPYEEMPPDVPVEKKDTGGFFTILGHDREKIFIYQHETKMVMERGMADWSDSALTAIAPLQWWEMNFSGEKGMNKKMAVNWLQRTAFSRGFFDPSTRRGRGAWRDDGRIVYHFGDCLMVDGKEMDVSKVDSAYVYEQARRLRRPSETAMTDEDGRRIVEVAKLFRWNRPASAILLCGWVALATLCGSLKWRPHVWITGGAGSGKSTILTEFVQFLMNGASIYAQGNSTEAGIRQTLKADALPVLFDESEQNDERERNRIQAVIALIRQSSTESDARTMKGTTFGNSMEFIIRSMFCLSSIMVGMKHQADYERLCILALRPKRDDEDASAAWESIKGPLFKLKADTDMPARLMRRSLNLLPITLQNIEVFTMAAAQKFGSQRDGDQFGTMLAGAWSLVSTRVATLEDATAMIGRYDWSDYIENSKTEESTKALAALLNSLIRMQNGIQVSTFELIAAAAGHAVETCDVSMRNADAVLRRHGMQVKFFGKGVQNAALLLANTSTELPKLLEGTSYASDILGQLARVDGAYKVEPQSFNGTKSRALAIPLPLILDGVEERQPGEDDEDLPF
ncbi:toprim domain-containing protein [Parvibaculum sp.]|uniref:toprim domain-containing protein n=1 Tax=Parvibaculum sp. TaxID=2024848 RepID=UPI002732E74D|nr:toprim domain-containing protein [Parvibaculum sp.]MDP3328752.1 toprim domain-containing protein [Parvibaculum sp.]